MPTSVYLAIPIAFVIAVLQSTGFARMEFFGVTPHVLPIIVIAIGLARGTHEGVLWAFVCGLFVDLFSIGPVGSTVIPLMIAVVVVGLLGSNLLQARIIAPFILATLAMFIFLAANLLLLTVSGYSISGAYWGNVPLSSLLHGALTIPLYWLLISLNRIVGSSRIDRKSSQLT